MVKWNSKFRLLGPICCLCRVQSDTETVFFLTSKVKFLPDAIWSEKGQWWQELTIEARGLDIHSPKNATSVSSLCFGIRSLPQNSYESACSLSAGGRRDKGDYVAVNRLYLLYSQTVIFVSFLLWNSKYTNLGSFCLRLPHQQWFKLAE